MASYGGLEGILTGLTKSTDHPSRSWQPWDGQHPGFPSTGILFSCWAEYSPCSGIQSRWQSWHGFRGARVKTLYEGIM